jgi:hypothetical protein
MAHVKTAISGFAIELLGVGLKAVVPEEIYQDLGWAGIVIGLCMLLWCAVDSVLQWRGLNLDIWEKIPLPKAAQIAHAALRETPYNKMAERVNSPEKSDGILKFYERQIGESAHVAGGKISRSDLKRYIEEKRGAKISVS